MKLVDLRPRFVFSGGEGVSDAAGNPVPERKGVGFSCECPCGNIECGRLYIDFENPLDGGPPLGGREVRWKRAGDTFETMSLHPSIQRMDNCKYHGFLTEGEFKP